MTPEEKEKLIAEKESEINGLKNLLIQGDYKSRKLIAEFGAILREQFPNVDMPIYEKYLKAEEEAQTFREKINKLKKEIEDLKK